MEAWTDNIGVVEFRKYKNHLMMFDTERKTISACNTETLDCFDKVNGKWVRLADTVAHIDI